MKSLVTATFKSRVVAQAATVHLAEDGVPRAAISVLATEPSLPLRRDGAPPEGAAAGAAIGGMLGAMAASFLSVGAIAVPGLGLAAVGTLVAAFAGAGAGGTTGGLLGAAIASVAGHESKLAKPEVTVGVYVAPDDAERIAELLETVGARSVSVS
jgi:hypothetical protein